MKSATINFAALVRARELRGLAQGEVAQLVGIDQSTLSKIETGERQTSGKTLAKLCKVLRIRIEDALLPDAEAAA